LRNLLNEIPDINVNLDLSNEAISGNGVSLFLYSVSENPYLKNQEFSVKTSTKLVPAPVVLDLYYLIVPFSSAPDKNAARETEQMILGAVIRTLYDNSIINGPQLGESLIESGNTELKIIPNGLSLDQMNYLWSIIRHTSYRVSLSYLVTPLKLPSARTLDVTRVVSKQIDFVKKGVD
jgi:hypothetical protein